MQLAISILCLSLCVFEKIYMGGKCVSAILIYVFNKHGQQDWIMLTECSSQKNVPTHEGRNLQEIAA